MGSTAITRMMQAGFDGAEVSLKAGELTTAAGAVIGERVAMIAAATRNPYDGDYLELGRMIPEKIEAFSNAGVALVDEWWALQRDVGEYLLYVGRAMAGAWPPFPGDVVELMERTEIHGARLAACAIVAAGVALAPVHKTATLNAQRLSRRKCSTGHPA